MTTIPQVCFLESFAQPDAAEQLSQSQGCSKFDQLRPSRVVIAGDEDALESVRTVHSPKTPQSSSRFAASPASSSKASSSPLVVKRCASFALSACAPQELSDAQVDEKLHGWKALWVKKLVASGWTGKADVALALLGVVTMAMHAAGEANQSSSPFYPSDALATVANGSVLAAAAYAVRHPDLFMELIQTLALLGQLLCVSPAARLPSIALVSGVSNPVALAAVGVFVGRQWRWRLVFLCLTIVTALVALTQQSDGYRSYLAAVILALVAHTFVLFLRRVTSVGSDQ